MRQHKIVFAGPPGAGKTTAIAALSDTPPVQTDVRNTDPSLAKERTTVGLDFGQVNLGDGMALQLYGAPGQQRFDFMWRIVAANALGLILLVDNSRAQTLADFARDLDVYQELLPGMNCAVGIGRTEAHPAPGVDAYAGLMAERGLVVPVLPVDVRRREDVLMLVEVVLAQAEVRGGLT